MKGLHEGAKTSSLSARFARIANKVELDGGFQAKGEVDLGGIVVSGDVDCSNGQFVRGDVEYPNGQLDNGKACALSFDEAKIDGVLKLGSGFNAKGKVSASGATLGSLDCSGGIIENAGAETLALDCNSVKVSREALFHQGFEAKGAVSFIAAIIGANLECGGGSFLNMGANRPAIQAGGAKIAGNVLMRKGFKAEGMVDLRSATIDGEFECTGGRIKNPGKTALDARRIRVGRNIFLNGDDTYGAFQSVGDVDLNGAIVGGSLKCTGAHFCSPRLNRFALKASEANIAGSVEMDDGFEADGCVSFDHARVGVYFKWRGVKSPKNATLDLKSARVGSLWDEEESWPALIWLDGFVYDEIYDNTAATANADTRLEWLHLQPRGEFRPQPYEQLAGVLIKMGFDEEAKEVRVAKNVDHARHTDFPSWSWLWYGWFGKAIGYGYRPEWAFLWSVLVICFGGMLFKRGHNSKIILPTKLAEDAKPGESEEVGPVPAAYPEFNAFIYSLETFVPLLKLGIDEFWAPSADCGNRFHIMRFHVCTTGSLLRCYLWMHIILGWILTTLWVGALTGLAKS